MINSVLIHFTINVFIKKANSIEKHTPFLFENKFIAVQTHNPEVSTGQDGAVVLRLYYPVLQDRTKVQYLSCLVTQQDGGRVQERT